MFPATSLALTFAPAASNDRAVFTKSRVMPFSTKFRAPYVTAINGEARMCASLRSRSCVSAVGDSFASLILVSTVSESPVKHAAQNGETSVEAIFPETLR